MVWSNTFEPTALIAGDLDLVARSLTILSGSQLASGAIVNNVATSAVTTVLPRGTLLGRVTASDKYIPCVKTASDGSQTPACILAADTDPSGGDVVTEAYFLGEFAGERMAFDASWTIATLQAALRQALSTLFVRSIGVLG